jgi:hypothetical protein
MLAAVFGKRGGSMGAAHLIFGSWTGDTIEWLKGAIGWVEHYLSPILIILLLAVELYAVRLIRREGRERKSHIRAVHDHTTVLSRILYEVVIEEEVKEAEERIYCYWHSLHKVQPGAPDDGPADRYRKINEELIAAHEDNLDVRLIVARDPDRIVAAYDLFAAGIPVKFQKILSISDLRFSLFDETRIVIGMAESQKNSDKPSRHGVGVANYKLHAMLLEYFKAEWDSATEFDEYLRGIVTPAVLEDPTNPLAMIAEQLGVKISDIERVGEKKPAEGCEGDEDG